ncbi:uncharacterized protein LOC100572569 [Acyrthosiphon pisum]|uniref:Uncharacterized protein n=1 Tax=Acyrthosiphon pisum TaxID=7029 RepID=A0A8R2NRH4_ACYPI|nr:uncharacterized protein LOC100572569 [Acyrthosiphon pisum]XP_029346358.1 uncharacterized protein LOC100572569 [Acyrthosiphon pisum]|eukprot:XP_003242617.1 PREDICTED: uncharacterized protein LOC100572569 [Acyrthosiphon pisum]
MGSTDVIARVSAFGGKWVSLTCDSERFDIDSGRVRCQYTVADYMSAVDGAAVIVVPATFLYASQMVAHVVLPGSGRGHADVTVRRWAVRCARPYRFAYVDGRRYEVLGVSDAFTFVHCSGGSCDCGADFRMVLPVLQADDHRTTDHTMSAFVSALMDTRSSACPVCNVPSNHRQVLEYLTTNIDRLSAVHSNINRDHIKQTECLNDCTSLLEFQHMKIKMLNRETENCQRFADDLVSSLLKNRKAIFKTGIHTIYVKMDETPENEPSASEYFMDSVINSQKQTIVKLTSIYKEITIMMNTMQLFAKVL